MERRAQIESWLESQGCEVRAFSSAEDLRIAVDPRESDCILLDFSVDDPAGERIHAWLRSANSVTCVVFMAGNVNVASAMEAIRNGACDLVQRPFDREKLLEVVNRAVGITQERRVVHRRSAALDERLDSLTIRELEVYQHLLLGKSSKEIARLLEISARTVDHHRSSILRKLRVPSVAGLANFATTGHVRVRPASSPRQDRRAGE